MRVLVALLCLQATACRPEPASPGTGAPAVHYELDCASSDTATAAQLYCVRTDTRTGDVLRVDHTRLPTSNGSTAAGDAPAGRFTTVCAATSTDTRSDFYCVRLNTESGEMLLVNLQKVNVVPR